MTTALKIDNSVRLQQIKNEIQGHFLAVGKLLDEVDSDKLYKLDGQDTLMKWVVNTLGYSKSWASQHMAAYRQNTQITNAGSLPLKNLTAARELNHVIQDKTNIDAIAVAILASNIAKDDGRESITLEDINAAYQHALVQYPEPVQIFCEQFGITNPDKVKIITEWFFSGANSDESKWSSMRDSGKLIINHPDKDDEILDLSAATASDMSKFAVSWQNNVKRIQMDSDPNRHQFVGTMDEIIVKLRDFKNQYVRVTVVIEKQS